MNGTIELTDQLVSLRKQATLGVCWMEYSEAVGTLRKGQKRLQIT